MAYFPLFADSSSLRCLVVGGGSVAYRKLQVLVRFDVRCTVIAPIISREIQEFSSEFVDIVEREFKKSYLTHCNLVVIATDNQELNKSISDLCHTRNIPVNVVDNEIQSSFIFPAIIDRDPVTIAISSGGSSPTLARRLRTNIEAIIPNSIGNLATYLKKKREELTSSSIVGSKKEFWDRVLDSALPELIAKNREGKADELFDELAHDVGTGGFVSLVGAGPGDPDLLTLKALHAMQRADVVYYDNLVSEGVLDVVRRDARKIYVGKKRAFKNVRQEEISRMLLVDARKGLRVVRLKGGDPMLFGRGGEETSALLAENVDFEVIPGITAALGCAAYAGIPLTHRDFAQSVRFVTGQLRDGKVNLDWPELAKPDQTLVVYMGLSGLAQFTANLLENGLEKTTPVAVISRGTLSDQVIVCDTVERIADKVHLLEIRGPTTTIVGNVIKVASHLRIDSA